MSDLDEIRKRLDKLKGSNKESNVTDEQLQEKLNKLKGLNDETKKPTKSNYFVPPKFNSAAEESDYLFKQLCEEVDIDQKFDSRYKVDNRSNLNSNDEQLTANLSTNDDFNLTDNSLNKNELKNELKSIKAQMKELNYEFKDLSKNKKDKKDKVDNTSDSKLKKLDDDLNETESSDDETNFVQLAHKFVDEVKLETSIQTDKQTEDEDSPKDEPFDFCHICSEDAVLNCIDCKERFCLDCFKEFHQDQEYRTHRYSKFKAK